MQQIVKPYAGIDHIVLSGSRALDRNLQSAILADIGGLADVQPDADHNDTGLPSEIRNTFIAGGLRPLISALDQMCNPTMAPTYGAADMSWQQSWKPCMDPCGQLRSLPDC